jgi:hypothetical protein
VHRAAHSCQNASVSASAACGSTATGGGSCDGVYVSTKQTRSPSAITKSLAVVSPSPRSGASVCRSTMFGPAIARSAPSGVPSSTRLTQGMVEP